MAKIRMKALSAPTVSSSSSKKIAKEDNGSKMKKQMKENDPNALKRAMSAFMFFCQTEREYLKKCNPGIHFTELGRLLGNRWIKMTADEKSPYEEKARLDKKRYDDEISRYKNVDYAEKELHNMAIASWYTR